MRHGPEVKCSFCETTTRLYGKNNSPLEGWSPGYLLLDGSHTSGPVCPRCQITHLEDDGSDELKLRSCPKRLAFLSDDRGMGFGAVSSETEDTLVIVLASREIVAFKKSDVLVEESVHRGVPILDIYVRKP